VYRRNDVKTRTLWAMFATIIFMYSCGVVNFVLDMCMLTSNSDVNVRTVLATLLLEYTVVCYVLPLRPEC
jgi:hypothetical protein